MDCWQRSMSTFRQRYSLRYSIFLRFWISSTLSDCMSAIAFDCISDKAFTFPPFFTFFLSLPLFFTRYFRSTCFTSGISGSVSPPLSSSRSCEMAISRLTSRQVNCWELLQLLGEGERRGARASWTICCRWERPSEGWGSCRSINLASPFKVQSCPKPVYCINLRYCLVLNTT